MSGLPSYRGFRDRSVESALYGVLQRRFLNEPKECDRVVGDLLAELLPGRDDVRLLDVGCGNGQTLRYLERGFTHFKNGDRVGWRLTGIDIRPEAVSESDGTVELADLFDYDPGGFRDVIVCQSVTYAFTDEQFSEALARFRSWLAPGGLVILFDMFTPWEQHLTVVERSLHHPDGHLLMVRPYSQLREVASSTGFGVLEIRPFSFKGGRHWADPHDLRSYDQGGLTAGLTMRGCFNQPQAHAVLVAV